MESDLSPIYKSGMAATPVKKRAVASEGTRRSLTWDCEDDRYSHPQKKKKSKVLGSGTENFNYCSTLLQQEFVASNPRGEHADQEMVQSMDGLYSNDTAEENGAEKEEDDDDSVIEDPQYEYFLDNLRPDGKSYVLDIVEDSVFIKYHDESSTPGAVTVCAIENANHVSNEAIVDTEMDAPANYKGKRKGTQPKGPKLLADKSANDSGNHVASKAQTHAGNDTGKRRGRKPIGGPKLSADKNPNGSTSSTEVTSEAQKHASEHKGRKLEGGTKLHATKNPKGSGTGIHVASETQEHVGNHTGKRRGRKPKGAKLPAAMNPNVSTSSNHLASEAQKHAGDYKGKLRGRKPKGGSKLHSTKNPNGNNNHVALEAQKHTGKCRVKRAKNHAAVPMTVNGKGVSAVETACFGQNEGQTIDHGTKVSHTDTSSGIATRVKEETEDYDDDYEPYIRRPAQDPFLNVEHFWDDDEANARKLTKYREKLMEELKMPYSQEEYERLLKNITVRKPVQRQKVLRGLIKTYEEDYDGKSLLDHHIDLKKKIDSVRDDHPKVLNLLRGFFYWLMNLSHEGAFMPWKEPSCLDVLPPP